MSANHTQVDCDEWREINRSIATTEAYVINREEEVRRIEEVTARRRREIADVHAVHQARVRQSVARLRNAFQVNVDRLKDRISAEVRQQTGSFGHQIEGLLTEINDSKTRISSLEHRIHQVAETYNEVFQEFASAEGNQMRRAELELAEVEQLIQAMEELSPERFVPTEYANLISLRESVRADIAAGDSQAALIVSQNSVLQATQTLARLQLLNERFSQRSLEIKERTSALRERIERFASEAGVLRFETECVMQEIDYDIDFWSNGRFGEIVEDFERLEGLLDDDKIGLEQLEQIGQSLEILDHNLSVCDEMARKERSAALGAEDTATRIYSGLSNAGWHLEDSGYASEDERNPHTSHYVGPNGDRVSIVVVPSSSAGAEIIMEAFSDDPGMVELTKDGVHAMLEGQGITIGSREERDDCHLYPDPQSFTQAALEEAEQRRARI